MLTPKPRCMGSPVRRNVIFRRNKKKSTRSLYLWRSAIFCWIRHCFELSSVRVHTVHLHADIYRRRRLIACVQGRILQKCGWGCGLKYYWHRNPLKTSQWRACSCPSSPNEPGPIQRPRLLWRNFQQLCGGQPISTLCPLNAVHISTLDL